MVDRMLFETLIILFSFLSVGVILVASVLFLERCP